MCVLQQAELERLKMPTGPALMISVSPLTALFTGDGQKLRNQLG
jgi:hypothetical protein